MPGLEAVAERNLDRYAAPMIDWARVRDVLVNQLTQRPTPVGPTATRPG
jgi:hypothetical protein